MSEEISNQPPDSNFDAENGNTNSNGLERAKRKHKLKRRPIIVVLSAFGAVFFAVAFSAHGWPALAFVLGATICGSIALHIELRVHSVRKAWSRFWAGCLAILALLSWLVVSDFGRSQPEPGPLSVKLKPYLQLSVLPPGNRPEIPLTNDFLILGSLLPDGAGDLSLATLVIPVTSPSPARLALGIRNGVTSIPAEFVEVTMIAGTNLVLSEEPSGGLSWRKVVTPGTDDLQFLTVVFEKEGIARSGRTLPVLLFQNAQDLLDQHLMVKVTLEANGMDPIVVVFWIRFQAGTSNPSPFLIPPTSGLKQDIRTFLERIDPEVLRLTDAGQKRIAVALGAGAQAKLSALSEKPGFKDLLSFEATNNILTPGNRIGDAINDREATGMMTVFILAPKDALKR